MRTGRPPLGPKKLERLTVYVTPQQRYILQQVGWGSVSEGVRRCVEELRDVDLRGWAACDPAPWRWDPQHPKHQ